MIRIGDININLLHVAGYDFSFTSAGQISTLKVFLTGGTYHVFTSPPVSVDEIGAFINAMRTGQILPVQR